MNQVVKTKRNNYSTNKPRRGISKAEAYVAGIHTVEYDIEEAIIAFGIKAISQLVIERYADLKKGSRYNSRDKMARKIKDRVACFMDIDAEFEGE